MLTLGVGYTRQELSVLPLQLFCKPKTPLKLKDYLFSKKRERTHSIC